MNEVLFSSKSDEWETPQALYEELNREFLFTLDPCATDDNHKCKNYYTKKENGLEKSWAGQRVFVNPPYSQIHLWAKKSYLEHLENGCIVVMLVPSRTDTKWFHNYIYHNAELRFIKGRLRFSNSKNAAPFPSMLCIFREREGEKFESYNSKQTN